jgi:type IV secretory pathway VirB10-like protein
MRIFVVWTRVIEPNGISILLGSLGVNSYGVAGLTADKVDNHFRLIQRKFGQNRSCNRF